MSILDKSIREFDEKLELELDGSEDLVIEDSSNNWRVRFTTVKDWVLSKMEQYLGFKIAPKTPIINLGQKSSDFTLNLENDARYTVEVLQNLRISISDLTDQHSATVLLELIVGAGVTEILWDSGFTVNNWAGKNVLSPIGGKKYLVSFNTNGIEKDRVVISWRSMGDTEGDSVDPFTNITDEVTATWDCLTGLKKNLITSRSSVQLNVTNVENGMLGQLNLTFNGTSLNLGLPAGSETIGKFTNLGIGEYVIVWSYNGSNFRFINYKMIPEIVSVLSADDTKLLVETVNGIATISLVESGIDHQNLLGAGIMTHEDIDVHIDSYENPHGVTLEQARLENNRFEGDIEMGDGFENHNITNLANGRNPQDAVTMAQLSVAIAGLKVRDKAQLVSNVALPDCVASGSKEGKTLTANAVGSLVVDGISVQVSWRIIVNGQVNKVDNGIYKVTAVGDGGNPWVLTRDGEYDDSPSIELKAGDYFFVQYGSSYNSSGWVLKPVGTNNEDPEVDVDEIIFMQFSGAGDYAAGSAIDITGNVISFKASDAAGKGLIVGDSVSKLDVERYTPTIDTEVAVGKYMDVQINVGSNVITHNMEGYVNVTVIDIDGFKEVELLVVRDVYSRNTIVLYSAIAFSAILLLTRSMYSDY